MGCLKLMPCVSEEIVIILVGSWFDVSFNSVDFQHCHMLVVRPCGDLLNISGCVPFFVSFSSFFIACLINFFHHALIFRDFGCFWFW